MQKWEYASLLYPYQPEFSHRHEPWEPIKGEGSLGVLKRLGDEGWELVSADQVRLYFKRAIPE